MAFLRIPEIARRLDMDARTVRHIAATDPDFPIVELGPRIRGATDQDLDNYLRRKLAQRALRLGRAEVQA